MKSTRCLFAVFASLALALVQADAAENCVLYWNEQLMNVTRLSRNPPPIAALHMAAFHAAIFDAVNGITRTHQPWLVNEPAPTDANMDAAVAGAAHAVMAKYWAAATNPRVIELAYEKALAAIPDGAGKADGIKWGEHVAELVMTKRATSGFDKPVPGQYASTEPGLWRETPPGFRPATLPHMAKVAPYVMKSPDQFRAPPPPAVGSEIYAKEIAYTAKVGGRDGAERTEYETMSAPFWSDDLGSCTPPGHWNVIAQDLARRRNLSVPEAARLFALLDLAEADAGIACWDTKFFYRTWRPETAIREVDAKVNAFAAALPDWIPLMMTPSFPSYVSGHSTFSSAGCKILQDYFGTDDVEFTAKSDGLPGAVRTFKSLSACRDEIGMSRVFGGIHYQIDNVEGQKMGTAIAEYVMTTALQPVKAAVATN
jgi:hypothetical protein